jgi:hypothetical protein
MRPIDADALKIHVCNMCDDGQRECKGDDSCAILCWINDMPTIEPEVRHGRWIQQESPNGRHYNCSECGHEVCVPCSEMIDPRDYDCYLDKYCGGCGVQMDAT